MITFKVNGADYSKYVQRTPYEAVRRVTGSNSGYMLDGSRREDYIATKYDPTFSCKPMPKSDMRTLLMAFEAESVTLQYTSVRGSGATRTIYAIPSPKTVHLLMWLLSSSTPIYGDLELSFIESKEVSP